MAPDPRVPISSWSDEFVYIRLLVGPYREEVVASVAVVNKMPGLLLTARVQKAQGNIMGEIVMEGDTVRVVRNYLQYLKTGKIWCEFPASDVDANDKEYNILGELYCFGQKYRDIKLKNTVIDALVAKSQDGRAGGQRALPPAHVVRILFDYTPKGSPVRKLLIDMYSKSSNPVPTGWPKDRVILEFFAQLAEELRTDHGAQGANAQPTTLNSEDYYEAAV